MDVDLFHSRKANELHLLAYGFKKTNGLYLFETNIMNGQFCLSIEITDGGKVNSRVFDRISGDEYTLFRVSSAVGSFVGQVRDACEKELCAIAEQCFDMDIFKSDCAKKVIKHVRKTYRDELQFLWKHFPENAILRRQDNAKWYAALLVLSLRKLGLDDDSIIDVIDLRVDPNEAVKLVDNQRYFPGYHMNKKHWITIKLDNSVPMDELFARITASYELARK